MRVEEKVGMKTLYIENEKERDDFMAAPDSAVIWNDGMTPVLKRDIERITLPRELLEEPPYSRAEKLITEMYEGQQALAPKTKLDVVAQAVRERAGDGGIASAYYDREYQQRTGGRRIYPGCLRARVRTLNLCVRKIGIKQDHIILKVV